MLINLLNLLNDLHEPNSTCTKTRQFDARRATSRRPPHDSLYPAFLPSGDSAITVEFSRSIDDAANQRVLALDRAIAAEPITGASRKPCRLIARRWVHYDPANRFRSARRKAPHPGATAASGNHQSEALAHSVA